MQRIVVKMKEEKMLVWPLLTVAIFIILAIILFWTNSSLNKKYENIFLAKTSVAGVDISKLSFEEAQQKIQKQVDFLNKRGFVYTSSLKPVTVYPTVTALEADTSYSLVAWDITRTLEEVQNKQSSKSIVYLFNKLSNVVFGRDFDLEYNWDKEQHQEILQNSLEELLTAKQEASFEFTENGIKISAEEPGQTIKYDKALDITEKQIKELSSQDIAIEIIEDWPVITTKVIEKKKGAIINISNRGDLYIIYEAKDWNVPNNIWKAWLKVKKEGRSFYVGIEEESFKNYLSESGISEYIEVPVQDAKFQLSNGRVDEFLSSQAGISIDLESSLDKLETIINEPGELELELVIEVIEPKVQNQDVNDLGIVEIIGSGVSNFRGSPYNRIHNIGVGADTLNGVLIAPGEEFSLLDTLGEIDGEHGYKQELVIKGDETIPEYGGGLCQIGTTVFRATLGSGLPVTQRRNHSYRVSYYEPAGTDATIYNPWPDYRFKNDTDHHILIQTHIEGTELIFDFWGTSDGRVVSSTPPTIYNIVAPPPKKVIKTLELEVGQEKCTESAHSGADAKFDYSVHYPGEDEPDVIIFYSHYIPWQEVCLLGVTEEEYEDYLAEQASSTEDIIE